MRDAAVVDFGHEVADVLTSALGTELIGAWFVGSVALGGYVPGHSDVDVVAVCASPLTLPDKRDLADRLLRICGSCPARGLEFTLYQRAVAAAQPRGADFDVNVNGGPGMPIAVHLDAAAEAGFWYALDRAIARHRGVVITGPEPIHVFAEIPRGRLLAAMAESMAWHRRHEKATLYSVLNACRAWRFAVDGVLGSKLEGAAWARARGADAGLIDAAVSCRQGRIVPLDAEAVDRLMVAVEGRCRSALASAGEVEPRATGRP